MEFFLIRHTPVHIGNDICYGKSDVKLAGGADKHIASVVAKIAGEFNGGALFFSSELSRCRELAVRCNEKVFTDKRINEIDFGLWEMKRWDDIDRSEFDEWADDYVTKRPPGGESFIELQKRAVNFLEELKNRGGDRHFIVTHAGVIRAIICYCLEMSLKNAFNILIDYGSVSKIIYEKSNNIYKVKYLNI